MGNWPWSVCLLEVPSRQVQNPARSSPKTESWTMLEIEVPFSKRVVPHPQKLMSWPGRGVSKQWMETAQRIIVFLVGTRLTTIQSLPSTPLWCNTLKCWREGQTNSSCIMANSLLPLKSGACVKGQGYLRVQYSGSCMYEIIVHSTGCHWAPPMHYSGEEG